MVVQAAWGFVELIAVEICRGIIVPADRTNTHSKSLKT